MPPLLLLLLHRRPAAARCASCTGCVPVHRQQQRQQGSQQQPQAAGAQHSGAQRLSKVNLPQAPLLRRRCAVVPSPLAVGGRALGPLLAVQGGC